jgi:MFS family permease
MNVCVNWKEAHCPYEKRIEFDTVPYYNNQDSITIFRRVIFLRPSFALCMNSKITLIISICVAEIFSMSGTMYFPALLPAFQGEWGLSNTEAGWINGIFYGGYAAFVPLLVSLTDRIDARRIYLYSSAFGAASMIGFGWLAQGTVTALIFRLCAGISLAGTYMPGLMALSNHI